MNDGISNLSIIPVSKYLSEKSEMVTEILFGEHFEMRNKWLDGQMLNSIMTVMKAGLIRI